MTTRPAVRPIINHVAISVDAEVLDAAGRAALLDFYGEVFGWTEGDNSTETGNPLIVYTGEMRQYLYFLPGRRRLPPGPVPRPLRAGDRLPSTSWWPSSTGPRPTGKKDDRVTIIDLDEMTTHGTDVGLHADQRLHQLPDPLADRAPAHYRGRDRLTAAPADCPAAHCSTGTARPPSGRSVDVEGGLMAFDLFRAPVADGRLSPSRTGDARPAAPIRWPARNPAACPSVSTTMAWSRDAPAPDSRSSAARTSRRPRPARRCEGATANR